MNDILPLFAFVLLCSMAPASANDPEILMTVDEIIRRWGYPAEMHTVNTTDGYILDLVRIPHGKNEVARKDCKKQVMLFAHGLLATSTQFVLDLPHQAPGFVFADAGYDVFLLNGRGSGPYSRRHKTLSTRDRQFWKFSWEQIALIDLPAAIDYALALTGQSKLFYVGHSQGSTIGFALFSEKPEYNNKVEAAFMWGPTGPIHHARGVIGLSSYLLTFVMPMFNFYQTMMGAHEFSGMPRVQSTLATMICAPPMMRQVCDSAMFWVAGEAGPYNRTRMPVYLAHYPAGSSTWNIIHYSQMHYYDEVRHYDFGNTWENFRHYGKHSPPAFNYSTIRVPLYIFWSENDLLTTTFDVNRLIHSFAPGVLRGSYNIPTLNHMQFANGADAPDHVYKPMMTIMRTTRPMERCERRRDHETENNIGHKR